MMRALLVAILMLHGYGLVFPVEKANPSMNSDALIITVNDAIAHAPTPEDMAAQVRSAIEVFARRETFAAGDYRALAAGIAPYLGLSLGDVAGGISANVLQHRVAITDLLLMSRKGWDGIPRDDQEAVTVNLLTVAMPVVLEGFRAVEKIEGRPGPINVVVFGPGDGGIANAKQTAVNNLSRIRALNARTRAELRQTMRRYLAASMNDGQIEALFIRAMYPRESIPDLVRWIAGG